MNITLTNDEVATLIDMLDLASMVAGWDEETEVLNNEEFFELREKMFRAVSENGYSHLIDYNPQTELYDFSSLHEAQSQSAEIYNDFRDDTFWEELVFHLADRDLLKRIGKERFESIEEDSRRAMTADLEKSYWREFEKNGIDNLHIIHPQAG